VQPRTYTLREAVRALVRSSTEDETARVTRHIRHWTSLDLLIPEGDKHSGTGRSREYRVEEIYRAAILLELAKWRVPMTVLAETFRSFTRDFEAQWQLALHGTEAVYLTMTWSEGLTVWNLAAGEPKLHMLNDPSFKLQDPNSKPDLSSPASAIVINLTALLRGLRF
jgi:hypothetical protein